MEHKYILVQASFRLKKHYRTRIKLPFYWLSQKTSPLIQRTEIEAKVVKLSKKRKLHLRRISSKDLLRTNNFYPLISATKIYTEVKLTKIDR